MTTPHDPTGPFTTLDRLVAGYLEQVEQGLVPDRQALLGAHPDLADALRAFFADLDRVDRIAAPLRHGRLFEATRDGDPMEPGATVRYLGDYELIEEIARGGMGVVYKAHQISLNRLVALKLILSGALATPRDVARFRAEAEAAGNLDHPHIVPIYEVGEHEGRHYYAMKFVEGTALASHPRGPARAEVARLLEVARAVHHAHLRGLLHRDLKPSNVLVDPSGAWFVTDFGLAKRLGAGERSFSDTGAVVGTPRYMAPEQAAGRKDLTVAVDVYSLGVILYERLTGRAPFTGDQVLTLLRQVREAEPPRPSTLSPGLDRDLETIVLTCLDKDPARRYGSADALAADLTNWLDGCPIAARPVGPAERFWRWCRRNPVVSGLAATALSSLLVGSIATTVFALRADARFRAELRERQRAERAETAALAARDHFEQTFAQSLIRPLDVAGEEAGHESLTPPEVLALEEVTSRQDEPVALRFLEEALRDPFTLGQLRARSEPALIAAVGLDPARRDRAAALFATALRTPEASPSRCADLALVGLELVDASDPLAEQAPELLAEAWKSEPLSLVRERWGHHLEGLVSRLEPSTVAQIGSEALARATGGEDQRRLLILLGSLADRLGAAEAARWGSLKDVVLSARRTRATDDKERYRLAEMWGSLASRLDPADVARQAERLVTALELTTSAGLRSNLAIALAALAGRLEPADAARLAERLADSLIRESFAWYERLTLAATLGALAGRLEPADAARLVERLADSLERAAKGFVRSRLAAALGELARRLEPADAARYARRLATTLDRETDAEVRLDLAAALGPLLARLEPAASARLAEVSIQSLRRARLSASTRGTDRIALDQAIASLMLFLDRARANTLGAVLIDLIVDEADYQHDDESPPLIARSLTALLPDTHRTTQALDRFGATASLFAVGDVSGVVARVAEWVSRPTSCRLSTAQLVALLKRPTCYGVARRLVLDELEKIHGRRFVNHWAFVKYVREAGLSVDLSTPPPRLDRDVLRARLLAW